MRRSKSAPWYHDFRVRHRFEQGVRSEFSALTSTKHGKGWRARIVYGVDVTVPVYDVTRRLTITILNGSMPNLVGVTVDGPAVSKHRYPKTSHLCMWHPKDPRNLRWDAEDGLLPLIQHARIHLFREEYWRETGGDDGGIWAGPEAPHEAAKSEKA